MRGTTGHRPVTRSFGVFFDLRLNNQLNNRRLVIWKAIATVLACKNWCRKVLHEELCPPGRNHFGKVCLDMAPTFWFLPYLSHCTTGETPDQALPITHDDVIKWKPFPRYWPFVRGIHRSPVSSPHKGQWRGALMFFCDLRLNKRLSKQSWGWWLETLSRPLWRHCDGTKRPELYESVFPLSW